MRAEVHEVHHDVVLVPRYMQKTAAAAVRQSHTKPALPLIGKRSQSVSPTKLKAPILQQFQRAGEKPSQQASCFSPDLVQRDLTERTSQMAMPASNHFSVNNKPKLLIYLERFLAEQLAAVSSSASCRDSTEPLSWEEHCIYAECLKLFIGSFGAYKPLLTSIMASFESQLHHYITKSIDCDTLRTTNNALNGALDRRNDRINQHYEDKLAKLRDEIADLDSKMVAMSAAHKVRVGELQLEISLLKDDLHDEKAANKDLTSQSLLFDMALQAWKEKASLPDMHKAMYRNQKDMVTVLEHKLQDLEKDLMQMFTKEETMRRIKIARHEAHKQAVKKVNNELQLLQKQLLQLVEEKAAAELAAVTAKKMFEPIKECAKDLAEKWSTVQQSLDRLALQKELDDESHDSMAIERLQLSDGHKHLKLLIDELDKHETAHTDWDGSSDMLKALGSSPKLPQSLRSDELVANMRIGKAEAEQILHDIWHHKAEADSKRGHRCELWLFVHEYFKARFVVPVSVRQWHYSFLACLDRYGHDADFRLFRRILLNQLPEEVYWDETELLANLKAFLAQVDGAFNGKHTTGLVPREMLQQSLAELWPLKTECQLDRLGVALRKDMAGAKYVQVRSLFDQTEDGLQTYFVEEVRKQHVIELQGFRDEVNGAIRDLETIENNGEVTGWEVRECFQKVDPAKPIYEAIHLIQDAFAEPNLAHSEMMAYADAMQDSSTATHDEIDAAANNVDAALRQSSRQHVEVIIERLSHVMLRRSTMRPSADHEGTEEADDRTAPNNADQTGMSTAQQLATMLLLR